MYGSAIDVLSKVATAPILLILNQSASPFDDLDFEWFRQSELRYLDLLKASSTGLEASRIIPTVSSPSLDNSARWFS
jgi:hypothetical protein